MFPQKTLPILTIIFILLITSSNFHNLNNSTFFDLEISTKPQNLINDATTISTIRDPEDTILPVTNISVKEFIGVNPVDTFNASVKSLNSTHWFVTCDYSNPTVESPFDTVVDRNSINHSYFANNYYDWQGNPSDVFEFWIDPIGFYQGYQYTIKGITITVLGLENVTMTNLGKFEAWKITYALGIDNTVWYMKDSGIILSANYFIVEDIWYNLTVLESANLPSNYEGPTISQITPSNNSLIAAGAFVTVTLESPYGVRNSSYNWDFTQNYIAIDYIETIVPSQDGLHNLTITSYDNAGFYSVIRLVFITDNTLPGINLIKPKNNTRIQGTTLINISITSGNGSFIYNWDNGLNSTVSEGSLINVTNPEQEIPHILNVYAASPAEVWTRSKFYFVVDNTEPDLTIYNFQNNSVIKGTVTIDFMTSEDSIVRFLLNGELRSQVSSAEGVNNSISFSNLDNGTYALKIEVIDTAGNIRTNNFVFLIHSSAFNWNWQVNNGQPKKIDMIDEAGKYWFSFIITSKTTQYFNLSIETQNQVPSADFQAEFFVKFQCESPEDIVYFTLIFLMDKESSDLINSSFPVYEWIIWDNSWQTLTTAYNPISHSWEATFEGYASYFALNKKQDTTFTKSVEVGGGQLPSFELLTGLFTIFLMVTIKFRKNRTGEKICQKND